jgi:hypothetical protein
MSKRFNDKDFCQNLKCPSPQITLLYISLVLEKNREVGEVDRQAALVKDRQLPCMSKPQGSYREGGSNEQGSWPQLFWEIRSQNERKKSDKNNYE